MIPEYSVQSWLFETARGKFDIDLAESGVQRQLLSDIQIDPTWHLDYSFDSGHEELRAILARIYGCSVTKVMIAHGAQEASYLIYRSLLQPGDHVVTVVPGWQ